MTADACRAEILDLHRFFEEWFAGTAPDLTRLEQVLADTFTMVSPFGTLVPRDTLLTGLRAARGTRPQREIRIEGFRHRPLGGGLHLAIYEEWQRAHEHAEPRGRRSTAIFEERDGTPHGVAWLHVHETWLALP